MLKVNSIFGPTIQGEGSTSGMVAIFIRFSGCNMWSGEAHTKGYSPCTFCDTDFYEGQHMTVSQVLEQVKSLAWHKKFLVVMSGGEPLLQPVKDLIDLVMGLNREGFITQIETNGSLNVPQVLDMIDEVTCSPKLPYSECKIDWKYVDTLKLLYPHPNVKIKPENFQELKVEHKYLQPIDSPDTNMRVFNLNATVQKIKEVGVDWRLSTQVHKAIGQD